MSAAAAVQVPPNRWDVERGWGGESSVAGRFGSFVDGAELFDNAFFHVSIQEVCRSRCTLHSTLGWF